MSVSFFVSGDQSANALEANYSNLRAGIVLEAMGLFAEGVDFSDARSGSCDAKEFERRCYTALGKIESAQFTALVRIARSAKALSSQVSWC